MDYFTKENINICGVVLISSLEDKKVEKSKSRPGATEIYQPIDQPYFQIK